MFIELTVYEKQYNVINYCMFCGSKLHYVIQTDINSGKTCICNRIKIILITNT